MTRNRFFSECFGSVASREGRGGGAQEGAREKEEEEAVEGDGRTDVVLYFFFSLIGSSREGTDDVSAMTLVNIDKPLVYR